MLESGGGHGDDAADARETMKDLLVYLGGFTSAEVDAWDVSFTEGAEQGTPVCLYEASPFDC